ncbi:MAG: Fe-S cluster assembly protein SufD [Chlamydiia bacterium]|nr:Fe-S cluster assembly protein SufD [Chlamydiia bacterium]
MKSGVTDRSDFPGMCEKCGLETGVSDLLSGWRRRAWDLFQKMGLPRRGQEAFQYVLWEDFSWPSAALMLPERNEGGGGIRFIDGFFQGASLPPSLICKPLDEAMRVYGVVLQNRMASSLKEEKDPFAVLNLAWHGRGAFLYVPPHTRIETPLEIHHTLTTSSAVCPRLQIFVGKGSSIQLIQTIASQTSSCLFNGFADVSLEEGASLFWGDCTAPSTVLHRFQTLRCAQKRGSRFHCFSHSKGAQIARDSIQVQLLEEGAEALLQGLWDLDERVQYHAHIGIEHAAPHCRSRQHYKGILRGKSRSSFEGKIVVRPVAQKTEAYQLNNQLLLSDGAIAHAKPNLEIFADDVKASHGATIARLPEEELFYLRSRGLSLSDAAELFIQGFQEELFEQIPISMKSHFLGH